jgi:hypothetical protein
MTSEAQFEALSSVITALAENPTSEVLHYQSIRLSEEAGLSSDELEGARDSLTSLFPATDCGYPAWVSKSGFFGSCLTLVIWLPLLTTRVEKVASGLLDAEDVDAAFQRAERDYFCP